MDDISSNEGKINAGLGLVIMSSIGISKAIGFFETTTFHSLSASVLYNNYISTC